MSGLSGLYGVCVCVHMCVYIFFFLSFFFLFNENDNQPIFLDVKSSHVQTM